MGLIEDAANLKDTRSRKYKTFTREEDYVIYRFWERKPVNELARLLNTSWQTVKSRYEYLNTDEPSSYILSLIKEFEGDKKTP